MPKPRRRLDPAVPLGLARPGRAPGPGGRDTGGAVLAGSR